MLQWLRRLFQGPAKDATPQQAPRPEDDAPPVETPQSEVPAPPPADPMAPFLPFQIRPLEVADLNRLLGVFRDAIQVGSAGEYDQQQRDAWSRGQNYDSLISLLSEGETVVAQWDDELVGFAQRIADNINMVYVHPDSARVGSATLLYQHLEDSARVEGSPSLTTHASLTALEFFRFMGFDSEGEEQADRGGVNLKRHLMRKSLGNFQ